MKKMLKSLFVGMIALMTTTTAMAQTTCYAANGESTPVTPKTWSFVGFYENSEAGSGYTPIAGNYDWRTTGVNSSTIYSITTPVIDWNPLSSSIGIKDLQFNYLADFPTNTQLKVKIYVLSSMITGGQQLLHEFPLSVSTDQANPAVFDLENSMTTGTTVNNGPVSNWRIKLEFVSTSTDPNTDYFFEIDNIDIGCQFKGTTSNNVLPVSVAGADQSITSGSSATLNGSGSYDGGPSGDYIISYRWQELSTGATLSTSANISVSPTTTTTYRLYVEDMNGGVDYDDVTVTVAAVSNTILVENTFSGKNVTLDDSDLNSYYVASGASVNITYKTGDWTVAYFGSGSVFLKFYNSSGVQIGGVNVSTGGSFTIPQYTVKIVM